MAHAIVIGGTRGLGREIVKIFSAVGHTVSVIGRRSPEDSDRAIVGVKHWIDDLSPGGNVNELIDIISNERGPFNYLVFCQRYRGSGDNWDGEINVSLSLTKRFVEASLGHFDPNGDKSVVFVSSVFGDFVGEGQALSYHVAKAGINQMMRYYAVNLAHRGIRFNAITPFTFLKDESKEFYLKNKPLYDLYQKIVPLGRMATAGDCAQAISFLCSQQSSFINGQNIYVDGGLSLVWPETLARKITSL